MGESSLHPEAAAQIEGLRRARSRIETLVAGLDEKAFNWRPAEGRWSLGENVDHLNAAARLYLRDLPAAIDAALAGGPRGASRAGRGLLGGLFARALEPPVRLRMPAPRAFLPRADLRLEPTMREFGEVRDALQALIERAGPLDLGRVRARLPTIRQLRLPLAAIFAALVAHERRHLWQMERIREAPGFPG